MAFFESLIESAKSSGAEIETGTFTIPSDTSSYNYTQHITMQDYTYLTISHKGPYPSDDPNYYANRTTGKIVYKYLRNGEWITSWLELRGGGSTGKWNGTINTLYSTCMAGEYEYVAIKI